MPVKELELWLKGEKIPAPLLDAALQRQTIFNRPYRAMFLKSMRISIAKRRTPDALVGNLFTTILQFIVPPTQEAAASMTREVIKQKLGGK